MNTTDLTTKPTTSELRKQLTDAQTETMLFFKEQDPELESLSAEAAKIKNTGITSKEILKESGAIVSRIRSKKKEIETKRMTVTKIIDHVKTDWITNERELVRLITVDEADLVKLNNDYTAEEDRKYKEAQKKILDDKNRKIELDSMVVAIKHRYSNALVDEISTIKSNFSLSWSRLTYDVFDQKVEILKNYKPKIDIEKIMKYLSFETKYLKPEEVESQIKLHFDFAQFQKDYIAKVNEIRLTYIAKIEDKREELKTQSLADLKKKQDEADQAEINRKAQEIADKTKSEEKLKEETATITVQAEIVAQSKSQTLQRVTGRRKTVAHIKEGSVDWQLVLEKYIEFNGHNGLEFLLESLVKNGQPEIAGIEYIETVVNVNRG